MNLLTTVHNNGIVHQVQIVDDIRDVANLTHTQLIWNGKIQGTVVGLNSEPYEHGGNIKDFRAIYFNGIMIVKHGKVYPTAKRWYQFWR